jgi:CheY-like chemotaxis protein
MMDNPTLSILVVDDEPVSRQMVRRLLDEAGIKAQFDEAESAADAIHILSDKKFDVAIVDYRLPDGTAVSILKSLRKFGRLHTPIIVMTAHAHQEAATESVQEGAQDYLPKEHMTSDNLQRAIRYSMQRHQLFHELMWSREKERREKELRLLQNAVTESGAAPSAMKTMPEIFNRFVRTYEKLLVKALDEAAYISNQQVPDLTRTMAHDLGDLRAGPKDVIDIHTAALKLAIEKVSKQREQAITEEARILLVQLMGFLVLHYRNAQSDRPRIHKPLDA